MAPRPYARLLPDGLGRRAAIATTRALQTLKATATANNLASLQPEPTLPPGPSYRPTATSILKYNPGSGAKSPQTINNKGYFALFALVGAAMVVASIWFFFWAKNGGFVWQSGDWDDYKSTVLRRKGKDGKTLSGATKTTDLGQKSIAGTFDIERDQMSEINGYVDEKYNYKPSRPKRQKEPSDEDVRAYRRERPARVGGLNRELDGSQFDFTNESRSSVLSTNSQTPLRPKPVPAKKKGFVERRREKAVEKRQARQMQKAVAEAHKRQTAYRKSVASADQTTTTDDSEYQPRGGGAGDGYYASYRPRQSPQRSPRHATPPRQGSPRKQARPAQRTPGSFDAYSEASSDTGTKTYPHRISDQGRNRVQTGYRRDRLHNRTDSFDDDSEVGFRRR